jgi:predicted O-methyltransferase YrrM
MVFHSQSIGACPLAAFPNDHHKCALNWSRKQEYDEIEQLRNHVNNADWVYFFEKRYTRTLASASWSASEKRCKKLKTLCQASGVRRVLEIGAFCGVSTLTMAKALPENGKIFSIEIDPFICDFGLDIKVKDERTFSKITHMVNPARLALQNLIQRAQHEDWKPFDLAIIDADRDGMIDYFEILCDNSLGLMSETAVICVDTTLFKGQLFKPYVKHGKPASWVVKSGEREIKALRRIVASSSAFQWHEDSSLLEVRKKHANFSSGRNPLASFPNDHVQKDAKWAVPQVVGLVAELRKAVSDTDWGALFGEGRTKMLASQSWSASPERCEKLRGLCRSCGVMRVLEIGSFCGVASLSMAEALPENGEILSLELDPYVVGFAEDIKSKSTSWRKVSHMIGDAQSSLEKLAEQSKGNMWKPFDLVVIDADKASMVEYFDVLRKTPSFLGEDATIVVDTAPFKGQLYAQYVKGKLEDDLVKSGQESIDAFMSLVKSLSDVIVSEDSGLTILQKYTCSQDDTFHEISTSDWYLC